MIFINHNGHFFNIPNHLFNNQPIFLSYSRVGGITIDGISSPNGSTSIEYNKSLSLKKTFSEMIERRNLMIGGEIDENGYVKTWDIVNNKQSKLDYKLTTYSNSIPYLIDTTGGAVHVSSKQAIENALFELLEKNALFLFWYGNNGYKIHIDKSIKSLGIYKILKHFGYKIKLYINNYFYPLKVIFTFIFKNNTLISCGVGNGTNYLKSIEGSIKEAFILAWQNEQHIFHNNYNPYFKGENRFAVINVDSDQMKYIKGFDNLPKYTLPDKPNSQTSTYKDVISNLPDWISGIHLIKYKVKIHNKLKYVKVFSYDLYHNLPFKQRINLELAINKNTLNLSSEELNKIPDCIFL